MYIHSNPIPHRSHKKSRGGCLACKARKVKCDEKKPVCGKCEIHFSNIKSCDYGSVTKGKKKPLARDSLLRNTFTRPVPGLKSTSRSVVRPSERCLLPLDNDLSSNSTESLPNSRSVSDSGRPRCYSCHGGQTGKIRDIQKTIALLTINLDGGLSESNTSCICTTCGTSRDINAEVFLPDTIPAATKIDPFSILPANSSPRVHALTYHWTNTLADFPTKIHSQYCTNPSWISTAISNPTLFNATLFVSAIHDAGLHCQDDSPEILYFKAETIRALNKSLRDPIQAVADETLAAVLLLTHIVSLIGERKEVDVHIKGLKQMISLRGGISKYAIDGVFLHMLCITNHLTAVLSESPSISSPESSLAASPSPPSHPTCLPQNSPLLIPFAISCGFHPLVASLLHEMRFLYYVLDAFTRKLLPGFREGFEKTVESLEVMGRMEEEREGLWIKRRLKKWGEQKV